MSEHIPPAAILWVVIGQVWRIHYYHLAHVEYTAIIQKIHAGMWMCNTFEAHRLWFLPVCMGVAIPNHRTLF
jgi:hypothetical protein